jgi:hypothetical protein
VAYRRVVDERVGDHIGRLFWTIGRVGYWCWTVCGSSRGLVEVVGYGEVNSVLDCLARDSSMREGDERWNDKTNTRAAIGEFYLFGAGPPQPHHTPICPHGHSRGLVYCWLQTDVKPVAEASGSLHKIGRAQTCMCLASESNLLRPAESTTLTTHQPTTSRHIDLTLGRARIPVAWYCSLVAAGESNALGAASMSKAEAKSKDIQHGPIHYPLWFGGSASCFAACVTHPLDLSESRRP